MHKPFAVWRLKTGTYWNGRPRGHKKYRIVLWVIGLDGARDEYEVRVSAPCTIKDLMPILIKEQTSLFEAVSLGQVRDSGFECYIM